MTQLNKFGRDYSIPKVVFKSQGQSQRHLETETHKEVVKGLIADLKTLAISKKPNTPDSKGVLKLRDLVDRSVGGFKQKQTRKGGKASFNDTSTFKYRDQKKILFIGTSITDESLDLEEIMLLQDVSLKKMICYTIMRKDGKKCPAKNLEEMLPKRTKEEHFDVLVLQLGTNEVSNSKKDDGADIFREACKQMTKLLREVQHDVKLVILKTPPRLDGKAKANAVFNKTLQEEFEEQEQDGVFIQELSLDCKTRADQVSFILRLCFFFQFCF